MGNFSELNMDAFSDGQMGSKLWLCENLEEVFSGKPPLKNTWIYGSWYGLLPFLLLVRGQIRFENFHLFDIDEKALAISKKILNHWWPHSNLQVHFHCHDCTKYPDFLNPPDLLINTSVEHFADFSWWHSIPKSTWYALQGTNMSHPEHVGHLDSLSEMKSRIQLENAPLIEQERQFIYPELQFKRFMIIGQK